MDIMLLNLIAEALETRAIEYFVLMYAVKYKAKLTL